MRPGQLPPTLAILLLDIHACLSGPPARPAAGPGRRARLRAPAIRRAVMDLDETRRAILDADGHLLIQGGPGSGKTTIALLKAGQTLATLEPEQQVVFLSFSRAAVRQIRDRVAEHLPGPPGTAWKSAPSTPSSWTSSARTGRC